MDDFSPHDEGLRQRAERAAAVSSREEIESFFNETAKAVLMELARNPHLQERDLLRLLERKDLAHEVVSELARHREVRRSYSVQLALVRHPKTPRLISLPLMKFLLYLRPVACGANSWCRRRRQDDRGRNHPQED